MIYQEMPFEELQQIANANPSELDPQLFLIQRLAQSGELNDALAITDEALAIFPQNAALLASKSACHAALGDIKEAYELIRLAACRTPCAEVLDQTIGQILPFFSGVNQEDLFDPGLVAQRIEELKTNRNFDDDFLARLQSNSDLATFFHEEPNDMALIEEKLTKHLQRFPDDLIIKLELARLHNLNGDTDKSAQCYLEIIDEDPSCVPAHFEIATTISNVEQALMHTRKGLELYPRYEAGRLNLGAFLMSVGNFDEARLELSRVPTDSPYYAMSLWNVANTFYQESRFEEAIDVQEKVAAISPTDLEAWNFLGHLCHLAGQFEAAITHFDEVLKIDSENIEALNNRAIVLPELGRNEEAMHVLRYGLKIEPENENLLTNFILRLSENGDMAAAISMSHDALEIHPESARLWLNLGSYYCQQEQFEESIQSSRKALELDPTKGRAYWNIASVYACQHDMDACISNLELSIELTPELIPELLEDDDFKSLHDDPRFIALVNSASSQ